MTEPDVGHMKADDVVKALYRRHGCGPVEKPEVRGQWVCVRNALSGFASGGGGIDLLALGVWRSAKAAGLPGAGRKVSNPVVAYEVKVSRSDFRRELYGYQPGPGTKYTTRPVLPWPGKAYHALLRSNYFMFATPVGLLRDDEVEQRSPPVCESAVSSLDTRRPLWLPADVGLVEVDKAGRCHVRADAVATDAQPLTTHETAELIRYALRGNAT